MAACPDPHNSRKKTTVTFWEGMKAELDLDAIAQSAIPVKGVFCPNPLRFMEIYTESESLQLPATLGSVAEGGLAGYSWREIESTFLWGLPKSTLRLAESAPQPPFAWRDADAAFLAVSFTYNTSAFFRIFSGLQEAGRIPANAVSKLVDQACQLLTQLYRAHGHFLIRNINNNFNMLLISRVVEFLVGKNIYDSEMQELDLTRQSLAASLALADDHLHLSLKELMGIAVAKGVSFIESRLIAARLGKSAAQQVQDITWRYGSGNLAIDDRDDLLRMISDAGPRKKGFTLAVILDDATETVDDLLWLMAAMDQFPFLKILLLVNTAQVSINFSVQMLDVILQSPCFKGITKHMGGQLRVLPMYCPFISFQTEYLPQRARRAISRADAVYIKGANFFETCQIPEKDTFHAFVVFGPISRLYTGLQDFAAVFAYLPAGTAGYVHNRQSEKIVTLTQIVQERHRNESNLGRSYA